MSEKAQFPLVVDLDGTLVRSDLLYEGALGYVAKNPFFAWRLPLWLCKGRAFFKHQIANQVTLNMSSLPYAEDVLLFIKQARAEGRPVYLCSASPQKYVDEVAAHCGFFDGAFGSSESQNLKAQNKADFLTDKFGTGGYDYIGDSRADWPVWKNARQVIAVESQPGTIHQVKSSFPEAVILKSSKGSKKAAAWRAIRPHQWLKNVLVFVPLLAGHRFDVATVMEGVLAFVAFSAVASSAYVLNDLFDLSHDRAHARKRLRPFASGELTPAEGTKIAISLLGGSVLLSVLFLPLPFLALAALYFVSALTYSLYLKRLALIDVMTLAGLYTLRLVAGGVATSVLPSAWLLVFSIFFFLSLALIKRWAELKDVLENGKNTASGRGYTVEDLTMIQSMATSAGYVSILIMALYISSPAVKELYPAPYMLWLVCPVLLYWISRMLMKTHHGLMTDDPIVFALKDRVSLGLGFIVVLIIGGGMFL